MKNLSEIISAFFKNIKSYIIIIIIAIIVILITVVYFQHNKIIKLKNNYETEIKLKDALIDSVHTYQNKQNEWVTEKLTIQEDIKNLEKINNQLTASQKELIKRIKEVEKENSIIAAALIETNVIIDSLEKYKIYVDTTNKNIAFSDSTKNLKYNIWVGKVLPAYRDSSPTLTFKEFILPNKQFIDFHWKDDKKKGYPIAFSVTNTNDYFKTVNIDSYAIKPINKEVLDPNGWQKIGNFFIKNGKTVVVFSVGAVGGATAFWILTK
jgi:myosin heavy subunit